MSATVPPTSLSGRRVVVRRYSLDDAVALQDAIVDSLDHLLPWMPWAAFEPLELAHRERLITDWGDRWDRGEDFNFGTFLDGALVGGCGLHRRCGRVPERLGFRLVEEREDGAAAPGEVGVERVWRLRRTDWTGPAPVG